MKINDIYSNDISNNRNSLKVSEGAAALNVSAGDIIEGTVSGMGQNTTVSFMNGSQELTFPKDSLKNAYVGEKRRFEVMGTDNGKLMLKDLGGVAAGMESRAAMRTTVDTGLVSMAEDFTETNGAREKEDDDNIERLTDEDYSELRAEGFSIEDFKAERLSRAIDRVKTNRAARQKSIDSQSEELAEERDAARERAARNISAKYAASIELIDRLYEADIPVTDANIAALAESIGMSTVTGMMTDNSFAYMIKNELAPSIRNIYTSVYSGALRRERISDRDFEQLEAPAEKIVIQANEIIENENILNTQDSVQAAADRIADRTALSDGMAEQALLPDRMAERNMLSDGMAEQAALPDRMADLAAQLDSVTTEDARWLLEYDIPLNKENLVYKKELEELKINGRSESDTALAAAKAIARGQKAEDAILISSHEQKDNTPSRSIEELTSMIRIREIRLSMIVESRNTVKIEGYSMDVSSMESEIEELRGQVKNYFTALEKEIEAPAGSAQTAMKTFLAIEDVASAPLDIYTRTSFFRAQIKLESFAEEAAGLRMERIASSGEDVRLTVRALAGYEASATEIRKDLGDSVRKAFDNADHLISDAGLEITEANRRAVRILGYNSMEITAENIGEMKYYDSKITSMIDGMKPSVVMSMIKRGFNPLDEDIDSINNEIRMIEDEEGYSAEEKFSTFLVRLEENDQISTAARDAYIGIYRLLYQIEKSDGAVIGAALASGRKLTLSNLLTESRSRGIKIDESIDDETEVISSRYVNSISGQINLGFQREYALRTVHRALGVTEPEAWEEAFGTDLPETENNGDLTLEQVTEMLETADKHYDGSAAMSAAVRSVMMAGAGDRRFLRSLGIDDSVNNTRVFSQDPQVDAGTKEDLLNASESMESMQELVETAAGQARHEAELELLTGIAILSRGKEIDEQLAKYDLLGQMAGHEHYRLGIDNGGTPARINLTVIRGEQTGGTVSLEVNTTDYRIKADLSLTIYDDADSNDYRKA